MHLLLPVYPPDLLADLQTRATRPEYQRLLSDCHGLYCTARQQLVAPFVGSRLSSLAAAHLPQLLREGAEQLLRVAQLEAQLMEQFFESRYTMYVLTCVHLFQGQYSAPLYLLGHDHVVETGEIMLSIVSWF